MKLNVVADRVQSTFSDSILRGIVVLGVFLCLLSAGSGVALDGIDLNEPGEAPAEGECSKLVQIKFPFLRCSDGEVLRQRRCQSPSDRDPHQQSALRKRRHWGGVGLAA